MRTFDDRDWSDIAPRLPGNIALDDFKTWLDIEETQAQLAAAYGEEWTLRQALDHMLQPVKPKRSYRKLDQMTRAQRKAFDREASQWDREENQPDEPPDDRGRDLGGRSRVDFPTAEASSWSGVPQEEFDRRVEERLKEYSQWYKDIAPNDAALLKNLCFVEVSIAILNALNAAEFAKAEPDSATINRYSQALKGLNEQALSMQRNLHIDRATREREAAKLSEVEEALAQIDAAGEFVEQNAQPLVHEHCVVEGGIGEAKLLFGYLVWDFPEVEFAVTWTCPRCGKQTHLIHQPKPGDLKAVEPDWVRQEEEEFIARERAMKSEEEQPDE